MKKLFSFVCALVCAMSLSAKEFYLIPNSNWLSYNARFAIYAYHGTGDNKVETWVGMTAVEGATGNYRATVDDAYTTLIFCRMNPAQPENNWDNKWNQTNDIPLSEAGDNNCYTIAADTWDKGGGTWSKYVYVEDVYTVVGAKAILGSEWNPTDTNNDMTKQADGSYKLEKTDVLLNIDAYEYKIVANHNWNPELMAENQKLAVETAGYHTLTFTYDASTKAVSATATLTKAEEVDPVIQLKGQFDNDSVAKWIVKDMALAADKKTASTTLTLTARTIEMGILLDGNWNSNGKEIKPSSNTIILTEPGEGNNKLYATEEGEYTFTYTLESKTLVVTFPSSTATDLIGADSDSKAVKIVRDGQLLIVRDGVTYNMMGSVVK